MDQKDWELAKEAREDGWAFREIAEMFGVSRNVIERGFTRRGWHKPKAELNWDTGYAIELYRQGWTFQAIAKAVGISENGVWNFLVRRGIHKPHTKRVEWDEIQGLKLWKSGKSLTEISKTLGVALGVVSMRFAALGVHRPEPVLQWDTGKAKDLYGDNDSFARIAERVGVVEEAVRGFLIRRGVHEVGSRGVGRRPHG